MRIAALVESADHVCCRYRLRAFRDGFAGHGTTLDLHAFPKSWWGRLTLGSSLNADVVIVQRKLLPSWQTKLLRRRVPRLVFDIDDAVFLRDSYSPKGTTSASRWRRFAAMARAADVVVCGNDWLAAKANEAGATRTVVVPTCVEPATYPMSSHDGDAVRLVWVGSASTLRGLERVTPTLEAIGDAVPNARLKLVCDQFLTLDRLPVERCVWQEATETAEIAAADIGIAWVPDDDWSRGKCGLKVLQYLAAGLPVVANPVGVHRDMVRDGETGFLASTTAEWVNAVARLSRDPDLRRRMGSAGRRLVESRYSVAHGGQLWCHLLDELTRTRAAA